MGTTNNFVTLYQDAHVPQGLSQFQSLSLFPDLQNHQPASYFSDLRNAILEAEKLICITGIQPKHCNGYNGYQRIFLGWSVWDKLHLLRGAENDGKTLGELLIDRANQGVNVYVMVWSEKTSGDIVGEKGVMNTHDMVIKWSNGIIDYLTTF